MNPSPVANFLFNRENTGNSRYYVASATLLGKKLSGRGRCLTAFCKRLIHFCVVVLLVSIALAVGRSSSASRVLALASNPRHLRWRVSRSNIWLCVREFRDIYHDSGLLHAHKRVRAQKYKAYRLL